LLPSNFINFLSQHEPVMENPFLVCLWSHLLQWTGDLLIRCGKFQLDIIRVPECKHVDAEVRAWVLDLFKGNLQCGEHNIFLQMLGVGGVKCEGEDILRYSIN
jgi:hypothetical protein